MKVFLAGVIFFILLGAGVVYYFTLQFKASPPSSESKFSSETVAKTGTIQPGKGDDYNYLLLSEGKTIGITSYTVPLDQFIGKKVEVKGQFSGTTLYADSVIPVDQP
jgi:hypothetical protein